MRTINQLQVIQISEAVYGKKSVGGMKGALKRTC